MGRCIKIWLNLVTAWLLFMPFLHAQTDTLGVGSSKQLIAGNYAKFYIDKLGNYYLVSESRSQIKKLDRKGDSIGRYDNVRQLGAIESLDVTNPLKLAVYYKDFATVVWLDRFLNPVNTIDLRKAGINVVGAVASSYDNLLWVFDSQSAMIKKIDGQGNQRFASSDLRTVFEEAVSPTTIIDNDGLLYLYDPDNGWYIFDYYGGFKKHVAVPGLKDVAVDNGHLIGRMGHELWLFDPNSLTGEEKRISIGNAADSITQLAVFNRRIYIMDHRGIRQYFVQP